MKNKAWSRRYDTWSIGCITLEFLVWLLHGHDGLVRFNEKIVTEYGKESHYFEMETSLHGEPSFKVHRAVVDAMDSISRDPECKDGRTALGDLLRIVRMRLLVVNLGESTFGPGKTQPDGVASDSLTPKIQVEAQRPRADSRTLRIDLDEIIRKGDADENYWLQGKTRDAVPDLYTTTAARPEPRDRDSPLVVPNKGHSGRFPGSLATDNSSLVVPMLTQPLRVG